MRQTSNQDILKKAGLKSTPIRNQVLDIIGASDFAISSNDIESSIGEVDRITLYRTLKSFEELAIIHKIADINGVVKYALCNEECLDHAEHKHNHTHVHFQCETCSNIYCLDVPELPDIKLPKLYKVSSQNITMIGVCKECNS
jgi:Fur family transcriptional regulator, ferric uptake regulator